MHTWTTYTISCIKINKEHRTRQTNNLTVSSANSSNAFLARSTSSVGPLMRTSSLELPEGGKCTRTPPHSSITDWMSRPLGPMIALCSRWGMLILTSVTLACVKRDLSEWDTNVLFSSHSTHQCNYSIHNTDMLYTMPHRYCILEDNGLL